MKSSLLDTSFKSKNEDSGAVINSSLILKDRDISMSKHLSTGTDQTNQPDEGGLTIDESDFGTIRELKLNKISIPLGSENKEI